MINKPHGQPNSSQRGSPPDEQCGEWKNDDRSATKKTFGGIVVVRGRGGCEWLMMGERLTNSRAL